MLHVATCIWDANDNSLDFSRCYHEGWVERLYAGFERNLTCDFQFVLFTDRPRPVRAAIIQQPILSQNIDYGSFTEPYRLNEPMILCGLDTVITGNVDHLAKYCLTADVIALPRDPFSKERACNGVALVPQGNAKVYEDWRGENDMEWMRKQPHQFIDDLFPGHVVSYKGHVMDHGIGDARIVYFHGRMKPHELPDIPWISEHWRA